MTFMSVPGSFEFSTVMSLCSRTARRTKKSEGEMDCDKLETWTGEIAESETEIQALLRVGNVAWGLSILH